MMITSRSFPEYLAMFGLDDEDIAGGVIDVSAGGSSFVAGCWERGLSALAVDPVYGRPRAEFAASVRDAIDAGHAIIADHPDRFVWGYYGALEGHRAVRAESASRFLADIQAHPRRYVAGELPRFRSVLAQPGGCSARTCCSRGAVGSIRRGIWPRFASWCASPAMRCGSSRW